MQKIRTEYGRAQMSAVGDQTQASYDKAKKMLDYTNKQIKSAVDKQQYENIQELDFMKGKLQKLVQIHESNYSQDRRQRQIENILKQSYAPPQQRNLNLKPTFSRLQPVPQQQSFQRRESRASNPSQIYSRKKPNSNDPLQSFFQQKKNQIQRSQVGFKSILGQPPLGSIKFPVKNSRSDADLDYLRRQRQDLRNQLQQGQFNEGANQLQKAQYQDTIKNLNEKIQNLSQQNQKLIDRSKSGGPHNIGIIRDPRSNTQQQEPSDRQPSRYRENNISKIAQRNMAKKKEYGNYKARNYQTQYRADDFQSDRSKLIRPPLKAQPFDALSLSEEGNQNYNRRRNSFASSHLRFAQSQIADQGKNIAVRSKLCFFASSLVLYRGPQFQLAIKSSQLINYERRRISIYVNNKDRFYLRASIKYKSNPRYYDIKIIKKLHQVNGNSQARQQIQVSLLHKQDLDEIIQGTLMIGQKQINFLVPAMFIEFSNKRPYVDTSHYQKQKVNPIYQFSNSHSAEDILPLDVSRQGHIQFGKTYAVSKYHEGYVTLRWIRDKVQVQTIPAWKNFLSYLIYRQY